MPFFIVVPQETERTEKVSRRVQQLETVSNNVKLLSEMLNNHNPESSTESDKEIMKVRKIVVCLCVCVRMHCCIAYALVVGFISLMINDFFFKNWLF